MASGDVEAAGLLFETGSTVRQRSVTRDHLSANDAAFVRCFRFGTLAGDFGKAPRDA